MKLDKLKTIFLELLLVGILFFTLFAPNVRTRIILSIIMVIYVVIIHYALKRRSNISMYERQVMILMLVFAMIYLGAFYAMGLYFGFKGAKIVLSAWGFFRFIIPISIIIITSEIIRKVLISQEVFIKIKKFKVNISKILTYIAMVLVDLIIYTDVYDLTNLNDFLTAVGFVLFASLSCNLLYNYISTRYGSKGIIIYRLITVLYIYIIPIIPDVYLFFRTFLRVLYPYIIYAILERSYSKKVKGSTRREKRNSFIGNTILIVIVALSIMLISCQFRFGILVIGSGSMTGTINKGDAVVFEQYKKQNIEEGQIIIFGYNDIQTVHRVMEIKKVNGEYRYYTKGDANASYDDKYRTDRDIKGLVKFKVKYIGYPTLWLRSLFEK